VSEATSITAGFETGPDSYVRNVPKMTRSGSLFKTRAAATGKARSLYHVNYKRKLHIISQQTHSLKKTGTPKAERQTNLHVLVVHSTGQ